MRFATLGSGSRGNATLVESQQSRLLIDNGFSVRELERRLAALDVEPSSIDALLLTHEHGDHAKGVASFAVRYGAPVWTTAGTWRGAGAPEVPRLRLFSGYDSAVAIGCVRVQPYPVPHDTREPRQFALEADGRRLGMLTDAGSITRHMREVLHGCDALILECNHDPDMLRDGPYPPPLQRRVGGRYGHLSNGQAAGLLDTFPTAEIRQLVLAHISEKNNRPDLAFQAVRDVSESLAGRTRLAEQDRPGPWIEV